MSRANHWEPAQGPCTSWDPKHSEACPTCAGCLDETYDAIAHVRSHNSDRDKVIGSVVLRAVFIVAVVIVSTSAPVLSLATASTANTAAAATGQRLSWPVRSAATASVTPGALLPPVLSLARIRSSSAGRARRSASMWDAFRATAARGHKSVITHHLMDRAPSSR